MPRSTEVELGEKPGATQSTDRLKDASPTESGIRETRRAHAPNDEVFETPSEAEALFARPPTNADLERAMIEGSLPPPARAPSIPPSPPQERVSVRPPVLASECLREDVAPKEPGAALLRGLAFTLGAVGALGTAITGGATLLPAISSAAFVAVMVIAALPLSYAGHARAFAFVSVPVAIASTIYTMTLPHSAHYGIRAIAVTLLAGALFFRAYHRANRSARVLVSVGVALNVLWLLSSSLLMSFAHIQDGWGEVTRAGLATVFIGLLGLSLLAFMNASSTGGCRAWGIGLLAWNAVYFVDRIAQNHLATHEPYALWRMELSLGGVAEPLSAAVAALAIAHLFVVRASQQSFARSA